MRTSLAFVAGAIACASVVAVGETAERKGFDLLTDSDDSLSDSASSTLDELKSIGSSLDAKPSSPRGAGLGVVTLGAGRSDSGSSATVVVGGDANGSAIAGSAGTSQPQGIFIPFGKTVPAMPGVKHYTATGHQECKACQQIINTMYLTGPMFPDLTWGLPPEYKEMGQAQQAVLQACPEFMNNWCYEDLGGTQMLRSPCPAYLTCHYCLGLNPLHCLPDDLSDKTTFYR